MTRIAKQQLNDSAARLLALVNSSDRNFRAVMVRAISLARNSLGTLDELANLIERGQFSEALERASRIAAIRVSEQYTIAYTAAGSSTVTLVEQAFNIVIGFNQVHTRAVDHMQNSRLRLIREFTEEQRLATNRALVEGIRAGQNPIQQARAFRASIGLTARQQAAVNNFRILLSRAGDGDREALSRALRDRRFDRAVERAVETRTPLTRSQIDRMVERYSERYVQYRSNTIARTEALRAVHAGNEEGLLQGADEGLYTPDELLRTWVTAADERVRPSHAAANGQKRRLTEPFTVGGASLMRPGDPNGPAREVIQCRCVAPARLVTNA